MHLFILLTSLSSLALSLNIPGERQGNIQLLEPFADYEEAILFPRGGGETPKAKKKPARPINRNATWDCWYHNEIIWANWEFRGVNWYNVTEGQLKQAIKDAGYMTKWEFTNSEDKETGTEYISASWRLPLFCKDQVARFVSPLIGITVEARANNTDLKKVECYKR